MASRFQNKVRNCKHLHQNLITADIFAENPSLSTKQRYLDTLDNLSRVRYVSKISLVGGIDPTGETKANIERSKRLARDNLPRHRELLG